MSWLPAAVLVVFPAASAWQLWRSAAVKDRAQVVSIVAQCAAVLAVGRAVVVVS